MRSFIRLFARRKAYYLTNIVGLAVGLAAAGFSILYFQHELTYDSFHRDANKIYRISYKNDAGWFASMSRPYSDALMQDTIPEIEDIARVRRWYSKFFFVGEKKFYESNILLTDPGTHFLSMFQFPFKEGVAEQALQRSNSVIISASLAKKYFGDKLALGEAVMLDTMALTVTGVFEDLPTNTSFRFDMLITNQKAMEMASAIFTFVKLREDTNIPQLEQKFLTAKVNDAHMAALGFRAIPVKDLHFEGNLTYEMKPAGNISYLWILGAVGTIMLLISFTNFINLSVALYSRRSREIAVRKSVGASSMLLSRQFYLESLAVISVSVILSLCLVLLLMPSINQLMEIRLSNPLTSAPLLLGFGFLVPAMVLIAGVYPGIILPRIHITDLFKHTGITTHSGLTLRMFLLGFQLMVLFFVCCSLWVIHGQFEYIKNKDLGFNQHGVIQIKRAWDVDSALYQRFKTRLTQYASIEAVSEGYAPGDEDYGYTVRGENGTTILDGVLSHRSDYDYLEVIGIKLTSGKIAEGQKSVFINETLMKMLGYTDPIGRTFVLNPGNKREKTYTIDGVVKDYHFNSLHHPIVPQILFLNSVRPYVEESILVRANTSNLEETVDYIQSTINELAPNIPLDIRFMGQAIERLYNQETKLSKMVTVLVVTSIVLSIVGLVALCSYMIEFRQKEIAIRRVLGAATSGIISLFTKAFVKATFIAFVIISPVCYLAMSRWTESFAYRTDIKFEWFGYVLLIVMIIVVALAAIQTTKAANMNPTKVLKE
ncbi:MAG TPA: ABC transporter permease [Cyclobacteriaceae bacterium]|nr:ABC transporter permease [Cyclobacteriaceae bacterium]